MEAWEFLCLRHPCAAPPPDEASAAQLVCGCFRRLRKQGRFGEPNFSNKRLRLYLFQWREGEWVVSSRRGGSSHRAACSAPLRGVAPWSVFDGDRWLDVSLEAVEGGADEEELGMATSLVVVSRFDNLAGLYRLRVAGEDQPSLECAAGQYYNVEDKKVLWHNPHGGGCWAISDPEGVASQSAPSEFTSFAASAAAPPSLSPEDASWEGAQLTVYRVSEAEGRIRAREDEAGKYVDPDFPAAASSVGEGVRLADGAAESLRWVRAPALLPPGEVPQLFNKIEPDDILQVRPHSPANDCAGVGRRR